MFEGATVNEINKLKSIHYKLGIVPVIASFRPLFWFSWKLANRLSGQNLSSTGTVRGIFGYAHSKLSLLPEIKFIEYIDII